MRAYERLLHYVTFDTASNASSATCPSTEKQLVLARALMEELAGLLKEKMNPTAEGEEKATADAKA